MSTRRKPQRRKPQPQPRTTPPVGVDLVARNVRLQRYYPIGYVNAIGDLLEFLWSVAPPDEREHLDDAMEALNRYDDLRRDRVHAND